MYNRKSPEVKMLSKTPVLMPRDDEIHMVCLPYFYVSVFGFLIFGIDVTFIVVGTDKNTQSGTQWDGMRHFGLIEHGMFYNGCVCETEGDVSV
jgi:hypothetical protein